MGKAEPDTRSRELFRRNPWMNISSPLSDLSNLLPLETAGFDRPLAAPDGTRFRTTKKVARQTLTTLI